MMNDKSNSATHRVLRIALAASVGVYAVGVGIMFIARSFVPICKNIPTSEAIYGPALTVASMWVIFGVIWKCLPEKKKETKQSPAGYVANHAEPEE